MVNPKLVKTTFILGAVCSDGVVLVSDLLQRNPDNSEGLLRAKINFDNLKQVAWGHAGVDYCVNNFNTRIENTVNTRHVSYLDFPTLLANTYRELVSLDRRCEYDLEVLVARVGSQAELFGIDGRYGFRPITTFFPIGSGRDATIVALREKLKPELTMNQVALIGYNAIKYLELKVKEAWVGTRKEHPQIAYLYNSPREGMAFMQTPTEAELTEMRKTVANELGVSLESLDG